MAPGAAGSRHHGGWAGQAKLCPPWGQRCCSLVLKWEMKTEGQACELGKMPFRGRSGCRTDKRVKGDRMDVASHLLSAWLPRPPNAWLLRLPRPPKVLNLLKGSAGDEERERRGEKSTSLPPCLQTDRVAQNLVVWAGATHTGLKGYGTLLPMEDATQASRSPTCQVTSGQEAAMMS